jgi:PAS domain S-box-containing protein
MDSRRSGSLGGPLPVQMPDRAERLRAVFEQSRNAMLIADDERRYRDVNHAACRLLDAPRGWILKRRIDDLTPPELRTGVDAMWKAFIAEGSQAGDFELLLPAGRRRTVEYSATANILPGMHLSILLPLVAGRAGGDAAEPREPASLTPREAEVMGLVALGASTQELAERLNVSHETARTHTKNAMQKLGARNRAHAVALALSRGELILD